MRKEATSRSLSGEVEGGQQQQKDQRKQGHRKDEEICTLRHRKSSKVQGLQKHAAPGGHLLPWLCVQKRTMCNVRQADSRHQKLQAEQQVRGLHHNPHLHCQQSQQLSIKATQQQQQQQLRLVDSGRSTCNQEVHHHLPPGMSNSSSGSGSGSGSCSSSGSISISSCAVLLRPLGCGLQEGLNCCHVCSCNRCRPFSSSSRSRGVPCMHPLQPLCA